jgi:hypothetical protein
MSRTPCGGFPGSRTECGKEALGFISLALWTAEVFIVLIDFLDHFEFFLAISAFVLIDRHGGFSFLVISVSIIAYVQNIAKSDGRPVLLDSDALPM